MENNYLNLTIDDRHREVFRVFSFNFLLEMFKTRFNVLVKPCLWDDPFENVILNSRGRLHDGRTCSFGMRDSFYAQCWTLNRESDAMWRIYSPQKNGVKIRTTARKLFESLYDVTSPGTRNVSCFIGKVLYLSVDEIRNYRRLELEGSGAGVAKTLLIKREAFAHENEVRLLYWHGRENPIEQQYKYELDPFTLIDEIVLDPRMGAAEATNKFDEIRRIGYQGVLFQSDLYRAPEGIFVDIP